MQTEITLDTLRTMHLSDLRALAHPLAQQQVTLRESGTRIVRSALAALGHKYHGTGGWHITAYATPQHELGFVNLAKGVAVRTSVRLDAPVVEALTVPDQGEGPQVSGAAAWTSPDVGEGHRASAPAGWVQLLVDVRSHDNAPEPLDAVSARVVMWGLRTCYGSAGAPGWLSLDGEEALPIEAWPTDSETRQAMRDIGRRWLDALARRMADWAGVGAAVRTALDAAPLSPQGVGGAMGAMYARWPGRGGYSAAGAAHSCISQSALTDTLRSEGVARISATADVSDVIGLRYYDLIRCALELAVTQRLVPVAEVLWQQLAPLVPHREDGWQLWRRAEEILAPTGIALAQDILRGVDREAREIEERMVAAYYARGPVEVDLRYQRPRAP